MLKCPFRGLDGVHVSDSQCSNFLHCVHGPENY